MKWPAPVTRGRLVRRYKRFFADVLLDDGTTVTAHCMNTGSMKTCLADDAPVLITYHDDPKRKLKYTLQAIQMPDGWVGLNTGLANGLVAEGVADGIIEGLQGYSSVTRERKYGEGSRIDLLLEAEDRPPCLVEVKSVTLLLEDGVAGFPDAVTSRGAKHLAELAEMVRQGKRAVLCYCVQRTSVSRVTTADDNDPEYGRILREAMAAGVEVIAYQANLDISEGMRLYRALPFECS